jgi:hypothetical protein
VDTAAASREAGEPTASCESSPLSGTVWYAYTPATGGSISASIINAAFSTLLAAYTGDSLASLTEIGCRTYGGLTFHADAGTTYYFQAAGLSGQGGSLTFHLETAPAPMAGFYFYPSDPSMYDTVQFSDSSYDPGGAGIQSQAWDFGDGATATDCCPTHRYARDGDYTVQLTVTTMDGRTGATSQLLPVRTHDVTIVRFETPQSASAGQTRYISVDIKNSRYPETVTVELHKSVPGGFQSFGTLTQFVPVRPPDRATRFGFTYTFTSDDADVGRVIFKAVATLVGARDALPADNEAIAPPTQVSSAFLVFLPVLAR